MRIAKNVLAAVLVLLGAFWALQGSRVINAGGMAGHRRWIVIGGALLVIGVVLFFIGNRKGAKSTN